MAEQQLGYDAEQERAREPGHEDPLDDGVRDGAVVSMRVFGPRLVANRPPYAVAKSSQSAASPFRRNFFIRGIAKPSLGAQSDFEPFAPELSH